MHVLARKYRPKSLDELIGQPVVVRTLSNAVTSKKLHHAYIFVGIAGSGKTTTARILAAMENCEKSPGLHPCGTCEHCKTIFEGTHTDVEEVDAAGSFAKVEQVRKLKSDAHYNALTASVKYYIIDECHAMSSASNDALLKLLEEPPPGVRFVLCSTDVRKMRPAILSRCQRHDFRKIYWTQISEQLETISKQEEIECDKSSLNICARLAHGSMRNGLQNLEKLVNYAASDRITAALAEEMFGTVSEMEYYALFDEILGIKDDSPKPSAANSFKIVNQMLQQGAKFEDICGGISDHLRNLIIGLTCKPAGDLIDVSESGKTRLMAQLQKLVKEKKVQAPIKSLHQLNEIQLGVEYNLPPDTALLQWIVESIFLFRE